MKGALGGAGVVSGFLVVAGTASADVRSVDGSGNNVANPGWGAVGARLERLGAANYGDGMSSLAEEGRPSPREVSNKLCEQSTIMLSSHGLSDMVWVWGQFLDHDITLTPEGHDEFAPVMTGEGDPLGPMIPMMRSVYDGATGSGTDNPRQQTNAITAFIDGSNIYGSTADVAALLREGAGGRMLCTEDGMLPKEIEGAGMANPVGLPFEELYCAGDVRANENPALTAMHTLWVREHNFHADRIAAANPAWSDEEVFQHARRFVAGELQVVTYEEFLPALLGDAAPPLDDAGYDPAVNPGILNEFSAAVFRLGHSMIPTHLAKLGGDGLMEGEPLMLLRECFFNPALIATPDAVDAIIRGLVLKPMQEIDAHAVDDLRNFLFGEPGEGGLDLITLNLQRGRDHGLPGYNAVREALGLPAVDGFGGVSSDPTRVEKLASLYGDGGADALDLWLGAVSERHVGGGSVGETIAAAVREQFVRLRDGDRFFFLFDDDLTTAEKETIASTRLCDVIDRNTGAGPFPADAFHAHAEMLGDSDGDGAGDFDEAIAGTDPYDAASRFGVAGLSRSGEDVELEWGSVPGKVYTVERRAGDGGAGAWEVVGSVEAEEAGTVTRMTFAAGGAADALYRVRIRR